jgi:beta-lactamase superfamily II metal-dependent hydrolase
MYRIEMLPAHQGDCLWIEYGEPHEPHRVLIDGGVVASYGALREKIAALPERARRFELVVATHVDRDHIEGLIKLLNDAALGVAVDEIWYNGWRHLCQADELGALQGEFLSALIELRRQTPWNVAFDGGPVAIESLPPTRRLAGGLEITLLSPTVQGLGQLRKLWLEEVKRKGIDPGNAEAALAYLDEHRKELAPPDLLGISPEKLETLARSRFVEDDSKANASSIAFLAAFEGKRCLFAGDAHPSVLRQSLLASSGRIAVDAFKLPHHGGKKNLDRELLEMVRTTRYLISTDGSHYGHPDAETIARILRYGEPRPQFYFNYPRDVHKTWADEALQERYGYQTVFSSSLEL